jgi:hypothetical protein
MPQRQRKISRRSLPIFDPVVAASLEDVEGDLQELYGELRIQRTDVPGEMEKQASLYAWWAVMLAEAEFDVDRTERALKLHAADRDAALRRGGGKVTEKGIENTIIGEDEYVELHAAYIASRRTAAILKYIVRSLEHRREMLVGLNSRDMKEWQAS